MKIPAAALCLAVLAVPALAAPGSLAVRLCHGGYVLVMRHAHAPDAPPRQAAAGNPGHERQLDREGRDSATAMGAALRRLAIPVGPVFSSPTYRALETVRLLGVGSPRPVPQLGDQGRSMQRIAGASPTLWLKTKVAEVPPKGSNMLLVTQMPNIAAAFPWEAGKLGDGETLVFRPDGHGRAVLAGQIPIGDWQAMR